MTKYNVNQVIDESKFNRFHGLFLLCCLFLIVFDGYNLVVYDTVVPSLMKEWSMSPVQADRLGSYALIGMVIGALTLGAVGDKIGRTKISLYCVLLFSAFMILCASAEGPAEFGIYRFMIGIGLGGLLPNFIVLMTEYLPKSNRSMMIAIMLNGYSIGGILTAVSSSAFISIFGWKYVFIIGGAIPLALIPFIYRFLPETPNHYLINNQHKELGEVMNKINPALLFQPDDQFEAEIQTKTGNLILQLFHNKRAFSTFMFWIAFFMSLLTIYGLNSWLPKLIVVAGDPLVSSIWYLLVLHGGAVFGSALGGWFADRIGGRKVLTVIYLIGALSVFTIGLNPNRIFLGILVFLIGATSIGAQNIASAFISQYYPSDIRSTGIGAAIGIGMISGILGPVFGGILSTMHVSYQDILLVFAIPGLITSIAMAKVGDDCV